MFVSTQRLTLGPSQSARISQRWASFGTALCTGGHAWGLSSLPLPLIHGVALSALAWPWHGCTLARPVEPNNPLITAPLEFYVGLLRAEAKADEGFGCQNSLRFGSNDWPGYDRLGCFDCLDWTSQRQRSVCSTTRFQEDGTDDWQTATGVAYMRLFSYKVYGGGEMRGILKGRKEE